MKKIYFLSLLLPLILFSCKTENKTKPEATPNNTVTKPAKEEVVAPMTKQVVHPIDLSTTNGRLLHLSHIYRKYSNGGTSKTEVIKEELAKIENKELDFAKRLVFESTQRGDALLSNEFLKKPSEEDLKRVYKLRHANWNSMSPSGVTAALLDTFNINAISQEELLTAYYRMVVGSLQLARRRDINFSEVNINLNNLGLENETEKGIAFYTLVDFFARKYNRYAEKNNYDCKKMKELLLTFPRINNKLIYESKVPTFKDFRFTLGNGAKNKSFQGYYGPVVSKGYTHFKNCP